MELDDTIYKELLGLCLVDSSLIPYITTKIQIEDIPKGIYRIIYTAISELLAMRIKELEDELEEVRDINELPF